MAVKNKIQTIESIDRQIFVLERKLVQCSADPKSKTNLFALSNKIKSLKEKRNSINMFNFLAR